MFRSPGRHIRPVGTLAHPCGSLPQDLTENIEDAPTALTGLLAQLIEQIAEAAARCTADALLLVRIAIAEDAAQQILKARCGRQASRARGRRRALQRRVGRPLASAPLGNGELGGTALPSTDRSAGATCPGQSDSFS